MADFRVSSFIVLILFFLWAPPVESYPDGGSKVCENMTISTVCSKQQALQSESVVYVTLDFNTSRLVDGKPINITIPDVTVRVEASSRHCSTCSIPSFTKTYYNVTERSLKLTSTRSLKSCGHTTEDASKKEQTKGRRESVPNGSGNNTNSTPTNVSLASTDVHQASTDVNLASTDVTSPPTDVTSTVSTSTSSTNLDPDALYAVESLGVYDISVNVTGEGQEHLLSISIALKNPYGYLDAADYPAMVFYSVMLVVYVSLAVVWSVLLCCSYKDLIRLQFFIAVAILLGVLEKAFFVAEYAYVNVHGESISGSSTASPFSSYLVFAEGVSALKKTFARVLLIIVSLGYGTVIPRLGGMLKWVILFGVAFFIATSVDGLTRAFQYVTREGLPNSVMIAFIPQLVMDVIFIYWIINAIVNTRRTLRLRRNIKKLAFYNHLLYTFMFAVIGIAAFCVWFYVSGFLHRCEDLQSLWLKECFWHIIFTVLLVVIMILWRPSSNALRYAYSLVHDADEEEVEQKVNKNLETMSKRQRTKGDEVVPPKPSHDMEEDLKWVEENLPTSTIDQVLQPLVDSDEDELMTSRFELSKMD